MRLISFILVLSAVGCAEDDPAPAEKTAVRRSESLVGQSAAPRAIQVTEYVIDAGGVKLVAESWPGRALDPVLTVGDVRLTRYDFPAPGAIHFHSDGRALDPHAPIVLQWGDDPASRTVVRQ